MISAAIAGIILIFISNSYSESISSDNDTVIRFYSEELEKRVEELILEMESVDKVSVLITLESSGETVYAQNQNTDSFEYVIYSNKEGEMGLKLKEINPTVRGVAVVCTNGDNIAVKEKIISMLSSVLGIPTNRITVTN